MSLQVNLRHLELDNVTLDGQLPASELDMETRDEVIQANRPLEYHLEVQKFEDGLLVQGRLRLVLNCQCVRCLKSFEYELKLDPWTCHLPLQGEEALPVVSDCVDLTPAVREDILLEFPQHPLCEQDCRGLRSGSGGKPKPISNPGLSEEGSPAWNELNKLKF
ncbi:MAG TPA: YceD family protein [Verrucomicrobiae bacterium]|nr:YceD family protein [Verrucomicrobiae bacterium]